jgi:hypothetical protein
MKNNHVAADRGSLRTVFRDTFRSREISLIVFPLTKCSRRIRLEGRFPGAGRGRLLPAPRPKAGGSLNGLLGDLTARGSGSRAYRPGLDNVTIGSQLGISERTARNHVSTIFSKLGVNKPAQAILRARETVVSHSIAGGCGDPGRPQGAQGLDRQRYLAYPAT